MIVDTSSHINNDNISNDHGSNNLTISPTSINTTELTSFHNENELQSNNSTRIINNLATDINNDNVISNNNNNTTVSGGKRQGEKILSENQSMRIEAYNVHLHNLEWKEHFSLRYPDVINYARCTKSKLTKTCVMCKNVDGSDNCVIPSQNKDVCKVCDKSFWLCLKYQVIVKFCKGKYYFLLILFHII